MVTSWMAESEALWSIVRSAHGWALQQVCSRRGFLFSEIIRNDVEEAVVTFESKQPLEKMEVVPPALVCTLLGILCFVGL